jgi:hypothetical protein
MATEASHEPVLSGASSVASFRPRHASPEPQRRQPQPTAQSTIRTQVPMRQNIPEMDPSNYHVHREPLTRPLAPQGPIMTGNYGHGVPQHQTQPGPSASSYTSTRIPPRTPMEQHSSGNINQRNVNREFSRNQRVPTLHAPIHTETHQHIRVTPHEILVDDSALSSSEEDSIYEEPALRRRPLERPRIVEITRPPPPNHQSRDNRSSHERSTHRSRSTSQRFHNEQYPARSRSPEVSEKPRSHHSQHYYGSTGSTARYREADLQESNPIRRPAAPISLTNQDLNSEGQPQPWRRDGNAANLPKSDDTRQRHRHTEGWSSSADRSVPESFQGRGSYTSSSSNHATFNIMPQPSRSAGPRVQEDRYPPMHHAPRKPSSSSGDSAYVPESPRVRTSMPASGQPRRPDRVDRRPPITYVTEERRRRLKRGSSSQSLDSGFVDDSDGTRSSHELDGSRNTSGESSVSRRSEDSEQPLVSRAEDYSREKRSRRRADSRRF